MLPRSALTALLACCLLLALGLSACGSSDEADGGGAAPVADPEDFPDPAGKTLDELSDGLESGPVMALSVQDFEPGRNRVGFGLFDRARAQLAEAPAVVYIASEAGGPASGPYPARYESLDVQPRFRSQSSEADPDSAKSVYVARVEFPGAGDYELLAMVRLDDRLVAADRVGVRVVRDSPVPAVGEPAPRIHTETVSDVGGNVEEIDTRVPPGTMHDVDFADVRGRRPAVLLFATPALCQSRVCGPVVDVTEEVKADVGDEVAFIHQEIFVDNEFDRGPRPQVRAFNLRSEPWLFTVDRRGRIAARIEGAFSARELRRAIQAARD